MEPLTERQHDLLRNMYGKLSQEGRDKFKYVVSTPKGYLAGQGQCREPRDFWYEDHVIGWVMESSDKEYLERFAKLAGLESYEIVDNPNLETYPKFDECESPE